MAMKGLFDPSAIARKQRDSIAGEPRCIKCGMHKSCFMPKVGVRGDGGKGIMIVTDFPTDDDAAKKKLFSDSGEARLMNLLKPHGIHLDHDCWVVPAVACSMHDRSVADVKYVDACRPKLFAEIKRLQPKKVLMLGQTPLDSIIGTRWAEGVGSIQRWRGWAIPDRDLKTWLFPVVHPRHVANLEQFDSNTIAGVMLKKDVNAFLTHDGSAFDWSTDGTDLVTVCQEPDKIIRHLREYIRAQELTAIDYETTGIKPWGKGHMIYTAACANKSLGALSFPMFPEVMPHWVRLLKARRIPKTAHIAKFEEMWSLARAGVSVENFIFCTAQASHIVDNRRGINSLEFQCYVRLGIMNWGQEMKAYLRSGSKDANAINRIKKANLDSLLMYGGKDVIYQLWLAYILAGELGIDLAG